MHITRTVDQHHKTWRDLTGDPEVTSEDELLATARDSILRTFVEGEHFDPIVLESLERSVLGITRCRDTESIVALGLTSPRRTGDETRTEEEPCDDHHWVTDFQHILDGEVAP